MFLLASQALRAQSCVTAFSLLSLIFFLIHPG
jgi:hypothetical protein